MENSDKPSSSSVQDIAQSPEKKSLGNKSNKKMSPMKPKAAKMPAKAVKMPVKAAKKQDATLKKSTSSSAKGLEKTRAASNRATLDSLMAGFQSGQGKAKTAMGMPLKDFSESAVSLLLSNYKVENEKVLSTTALAM